MSKTRNQRKRDLRRLIEAAVTVLLALMLIGSLVFSGILWSRIERTTRELEEMRRDAPVIYAGSWLPEDFDIPAYEAACQRYTVENGLVIPEFTLKGGE